MNILSKFTLKSLKENKSRTVVTAIGIILSVAILRAVATLVVSAQNYMVESIKAQSGNWHVKLFGVDTHQVREIAADSRVDTVFTLSYVGFAPIKIAESATRAQAHETVGQHERESIERTDFGDIAMPEISAYARFIYVQAVDDVYRENMNMNIIQGRMPQSDREIILPDSFLYLEKDGISDGKMTLTVGDRVSDGYKLSEHNSYDGSTESFAANFEKQYTVVGYYSTPGGYNFNSNRYYAYTAPGGEIMDTVFIIAKDPKDAGQMLEDYSSLAFWGASVNNGLLRYYGRSMESGFNRVLYGLGAILLSIIILASVSLIYNAFSISVGERIKQFGLLSSIGATKKQMMRSVFFEAGAMCCVGIPIGILSGLAGIYVTLKLLGEKISYFFYSYTGAGEKVPEFVMKISPEALILAAVLGVVTVFISAYLPAAKTLKYTAIEAIRQTDTAIIKAKDVKTGRFSRMVLGPDGQIALKYFKRNKRRNRATVISLFMSVVLFVSAYSLCSYVKEGMGLYNYGTTNRDIEIIFYRQANEEGKEYIDRCLSEEYPRFLQLPGVSRSEFSIEMYTSLIPKEGTVTDIVYKSATESEYFGVKEMYLDRDSYNRLLEENGLSKSDYPGEGKPIGLAENSVTIFEGDRYIKSNMTDGTRVELEDISADCLLKSTPYGGDNSVFTVYYPISCMDRLYRQGFDQVYEGEPVIYMSGENPDKLYTEALKMSDENMNVFARYAENRGIDGMLTTMNVFIGGFIALIALICITNIINTMSSNISLRAREFAVLKSVGMDNKGINRMLCIECALYGVKALVWAIPAAVAVSLLIWKVVYGSLVVTYMAPVSAVILSCAGVFAVVLLTMIYSRSKIKKANTADNLRNENL